MASSDEPPPGPAMTGKDWVKLGLSVLYFAGGVWQFLVIAAPLLPGSWGPVSLSSRLMNRDEWIWRGFSGSLLMLLAWWLFPLGKHTAVARPQTGPEFQRVPLEATLGFTGVLILTAVSLSLAGYSMTMLLSVITNGGLDAGFLLPLAAAWWLFPYGKTEHVLADDDPEAEERKPDRQ